MYIDCARYLYAVLKMSNGLTEDIASHEVLKICISMNQNRYARMQYAYTVSTVQNCKLLMIDRKASSVTLRRGMKSRMIALSTYHSLFCVSYHQKDLQNSSQQITLFSSVSKISLFFSFPFFSFFFFF